MYKLRLLLSTVLVLSSFAICPGALGQQTTVARPHIAVLNLEGRGISASEAVTLTDRLRGHLVNTGAFVVLDRGHMEEVLQEFGFQQSGCTTTECAVRAGKMLNVQKMVTGSIGKIGKTYTIDIVVIDVESSRIERSFTKDYRGEIDGLLETLKSIAGDMATAAGEKPKPAPVEPKPLYKMSVSSHPKGVEVFVNNKSVGKTPLSRQVAAGSLKIVAKHRGYKDWETSVLVDGDEVVSIMMVPLTVSKPKSRSRTWLWVAGGVGAAALGVTAYVVMSGDQGGGGTTQALPPFKWPPEGK